jgi:hypothetical protein
VSVARALVVAASALVLLACAGNAPRAEATPETAAIARTHAQKCGACHAPPEPGTRARMALDAALTRHKAQNRVRLTAEQWAEMLDYLAHANANEAAITR